MLPFAILFFVVGIVGRIGEKDFSGVWSAGELIWKQCLKNHHIYFCRI